MSEWREHVHMVPEHMHEAITLWIEKGEPRPKLMGHFMCALLSNDLMEAFARADYANIAAMHAWTIFLYNYAPAPCFGSEEKLNAWYERHHPTAEPAVEDAITTPEEEA